MNACLASVSPFLNFFFAADFQERNQTVCDFVSEGVTSKVWPPSTIKHVYMFKCDKLKCSKF